MDLEELHDHLFDLLVLVDDVCVKHGVDYSLTGGAAIGAVREKDFIAWDDDVDIQIKWEDYPLFKRAMKDGLPDRVHLLEPDDLSPLFYDFVFRIVDERWAKRSEQPEDCAYGHYPNYICIDVFPCCGCPRNGLRQKLFILMDQILYGMCMSYRYRIDYKKYSRIQMLQVRLLTAIGRHYSGNNPKRILAKWYKLLSRYDANETGWRYSVSLPFIDFYMKPMPNEWFQGIVKGQLRNREVPLISGYHDELTLIYGDYMTPEHNPDKYIVHV